MKIPSSIPKKYHKFIDYIAWEDGMDIDQSGRSECYVVMTKGISDISECHTIHEYTIKEVVENIKTMTKCECKSCNGKT